MMAAIRLPQILIRNSFNIFSLSSSSPLKEIRKRSQQLLQLAKIEEVQEYDIDIGHVKEFRNEGEIRLALERVSGIQNRLKEIFFWFEDHRIESSNALELISKGNYQRAIDFFEASDSDWLDKKNLALTLMFDAFTSSSMESFHRSLQVWQQIVDSDDFWTFYEKYYFLHDELGTSPSLFKEFRSSIFETLSAKAVSFYDHTKNPEVISACYSAFHRIGKTTDSEILQPIILRIKKEMEELEKLKDVKPNARSVKKTLSKIDNCFSELDEFKLFEYSPLIVLKNDTAEKLRSIAVDIYNDNEDAETAQYLLDLSFNLALSEAVLDKIKSDKKQINTNIAWQTITEKFSHIKHLIEKRQLDKAKSAYLGLDHELATETTESSRSNRIQLLIMFCSSLIQKGHELFEKRKFGIETLAISALLNHKTLKDAILAFKHARVILQDRLNLLDFLDFDADREALLATILNISHNLRHCDLSSIFELYQSSLEAIENFACEQPDENTQITIKLLGTALYFSIFCRRFRDLCQKKMLKWMAWTTVILIYFSLSMVNGKQVSSKKISKQNKSFSSSYGLTTQEKEAIEWFDILYKEALKNLRKKGYSDQEIAQAILEEMKNTGYSDVGDYLLDLEKL